MMAVGSHLDQIRVTTLPASIEGCEECLKIGSSWLHLRMCMSPPVEQHAVNDSGRVRECSGMHLDDEALHDRGLRRT